MRNERVDEPGPSGSEVMAMHFLACLLCQQCFGVFGERMPAMHVLNGHAKTVDVEAVGAWQWFIFIGIT